MFFYVYILVEGLKEPFVATFYFALFSLFTNCSKSFDIDREKGNQELFQNSSFFSIRLAINDISHIKTLTIRSLKIVLFF